MKKQDRQVYFFIFLGLTVVSSVLLWGELQVRHRQAIQIDRYERGAVLLAKEVATEIEVQVGDYAQLVEALAKQVEAVGSLKTEVLEKMVIAQRTPFRHLSSVMFVGNREGRSFAIDPSLNRFGASTRGTEYTDRDYYRAIVQTDRTFIGPLRKGRALHEPSVQIATPVHDSQGRLLTIAMGSIRMNYFQSQVEELMASVPELKVVALDQTGRTFVHPDRRAVEEMLDLSKYPLFRPTDQANGEIRVGPEETGRFVRAAIVPIAERDLQWMVAAYRPEAAVQAMTAGVRRQLWGVAAAGLLPGLVLATLTVWWNLKNRSTSP